MKIRSESQLKMLDEAIMRCGGSVVLIDSRTGKEYGKRICGDSVRCLRLFSGGLLLPCGIYRYGFRRVRMAGT